MKYPKKIKAFLINDKGEKFKLSRVVSSLRDWKQISTPSILSVIDEILLLIETLKLNQILIKKEFLDGLIDMCQKKIRCTYCNEVNFLKIEKKYFDFKDINKLIIPFTIFL